MLTALQLSGHRDSLAVLFLLREHGLLGEVRVYYLNSGAALPETLEVINTVKAWIPDFVEVPGKQPEVVKTFGFPSDVLTHATSTLGVMSGHKAPVLQDRYSCCARSIMQPLHARMEADGVTDLVRGVKRCDFPRSEIEPGAVVDGFTVHYPLWDWSNKAVDDYLASQNAPVPPFYTNGMKSGPDCINCTAWLEHGLPQYLRKFHPEQAAKTFDILKLIHMATSPAGDLLKDTLNG